MVFLYFVALGLIKNTEGNCMRLAIIIFVIVIYLTIGVMIDAALKLDDEESSFFIMLTWPVSVICVLIGIVSSIYYRILRRSKKKH